MVTVNRRRANVRAFMRQRQAKGKPVVFSRGSRKRGRVTMPQELKFFDTALSFTFDATLEVPATGQLALIPQGDTQSTRDGRQAIIKSIHIRALITGTTSGGQQMPAFFLWVVQDRQANGAAAAATDVMSSTVAASCMRNLNNDRRFKILKKIVVNPQRVGYGEQTIGVNVFTWVVEEFIKCNILMDWDSTTGAITEIKSNNIFLLAGNNDAATVDDQYTFSGVCRLRFVG